MYFYTLSVFLLPFIPFYCHFYDCSNHFFDFDVRIVLQRYLFGLHRCKVITIRFSGKSPHSAKAEVVFCVKSLYDEPKHLLRQHNSIINPKVVGST